MVSGLSKLNEKHYYWWKCEEFTKQAKKMFLSASQLHFQYFKCWFSGCSEFSNPTIYIVQDSSFCSLASKCATFGVRRSRVCTAHIKIEEILIEGLIYKRGSCSFKQTLHPVYVNLSMYSINYQIIENKWHVHYHFPKHIWCLSTLIIYWTCIIIYKF